MTEIPDDIREKAKKLVSEIWSLYDETEKEEVAADIAAALLAEREATVRKCVGIAEGLSGQFLEESRYQRGEYSTYLDGQSLATEKVLNAIFWTFPEVKP